MRLIAALLLLALPAAAEPVLWPWSPAMLGTCPVTGATGYEWETRAGNITTTGTDVTVDCDAEHGPQTVRVRALHGVLPPGPWSDPSIEFVCSGMIAGQTLLPWTWGQWIEAFAHEYIVADQQIRVACP